MSKLINMVAKLYTPVRLVKKAKKAIISKLAKLLTKVHTPALGKVTNAIATTAKRARLKNSNKNNNNGSSGMGLLYSHDHDDDDH